LYIDRVPYQLLPLSKVKNEYTSVLFAVSVLTGVEPPGHLTVTGQVIDLLGVASFVRNRVNACDPVPIPVAKVKVQLPVNVAVTKLPFARLIVAEAPVFPSAFILSE
jgi:hypothetical protein